MNLLRVGLLFVALLTPRGVTAAASNDDVVLIGAGFGRTGTASTKRALELLGFGPTHHMEEVIKGKHSPIWADIFDTNDEEERKRLLRSAVSGYRSTLDFPSSAMYRELMEIYPDAKVLLTTRSAESWYRSAWNTILMSRKFDSWSSPGVFTTWMGPGMVAVFKVVPYFSDHRRMMDGIWRKTGLASCDIPADYTSTFEQWNAGVQAHVPPERLLVYSAKEGWNPLVKFLAVPKPDVPFPQVNSTADFQLVMAGIALAGYALLLAPLLVPFLVWMRFASAPVGEKSKSS